MALSNSTPFNASGTMTSSTGMAGPKRGNAKVLTAVQAKRRALRQQLGITNINQASPAQVAAARKAGLLPGSTGSAQYDQALQTVAQRRRSPDPDPSGFQREGGARAAGAGLRAIGAKRGRKGGPAGGRPVV